MQINNLSFVPDWRLEDLQGQKLHVSFLPLLVSIQQCNKLTEAAETCDLSYRHAWNILKEAEGFFSHPVTIMERGRGAKLTPLGEVLVQSSQRIDARLQTQMQSITMELNSEVHRVLADEIGVIPIYASHGFAVALIPEHLKGYQAEMQYHGPEDALTALNAGNCKIAGFHLPMHNQTQSQQQRYKGLLASSEIHVLRFITREQGLIVSKSLEGSVSSLKDIEYKDIRFINRQPRSGARELFDQLLVEADVNSEYIKGYDNHEYTHSAVAAQVATGMADVGFGVKAAATQFNLDFVPITTDNYFWAYRSESGTDMEISAFMDMLKSKAFQKEVNSLAGYQCDRCGDAVLSSDLLV